MSLIVLRQNETASIDQRSLLVCSKGCVSFQDKQLKPGELAFSQGSIKGLEESNLVIRIPKVEEFLKKKSQFQETQDIYKLLSVIPLIGSYT